MVEPAEISVTLAERVGQMGFRVWGYLSKSGAEKPLPLHFRDYDDIEAGQGPRRNAGPGKLSDADLKKLQDRLAVVGGIAEFINGVRNRESRLRGEIRDLRKSLKKDVRDFRDLLKSLPDKALDAQTLKEAAKFLEETANIAGAKKKVDDIAMDLAKAKDAVDAVIEALDGLEAAEGSPVAALADLLAKGKAAVDTNLDLVAKVIDVVKATVEELKKAVKKDALKAAAQELLDKMGEVALEKLQAYPRLAAALKIFAMDLPRLVKDTSFISNLEDPPDSSTRARGLLEIVDTDFSLAGVAADHGDRVVMRVELLESQESGARVLTSHQHEFRVVENGFRAQLDAHLVFVDRVTEPGGAIKETHFEPAPSASWTLHCRFRSHLGRNTWANLWNGLDLGVGISVTTLDFEDDGMEIGAGVQGSVFSGLVQLGYGWNGTVEDDREYWFVGIGIIEALNIAGLGARSVAGAESE